LGVLNQEHHQERDDGGRGVDNQLPGAGKMENGTGDQPDENDQQRGERHALPSKIDEWRATTRNASLMTQNKSRSSLCFLSSAV
jgi:hypothetical protein